MQHRYNLRRWLCTDSRRMAIHFDKSRIASRQKTGFELKGRSSKMATRLDQEIEQLENIVEKCLDQKQNEAMKHRWRAVHTDG